MELQRSRAARTTSNLGTDLQEALRGFQSALTEDQHKELQAIQSVPDADSVLIFTAQLDAQLQKTRKSIAPKLYPILQSVRDFSAVVETFVSSNPRIAALIWGSVKLTIHGVIKSPTPGGLPNKNSSLRQMTLGNAVTTSRRNCD
ncbi:hypothetical protein QQX98_012108 [Neonectria punicea]|uniref:Uncharacterized protein n=1 Tax=Neonectria punicea TaxID=979145 RepID=A0ABR1GJY0_9HYPO